MRHVTARLLALALCIIPATASAQDVAAASAPPRANVFVGVGPVFETDRPGTNGMDSGWGLLVDAGLAVNLNSRVGIVVDNVSFGKSNDAWIYSVMVGPRVRFGGERRLTSFAHALVGLQRWNQGTWAANTGSAVTRSDHATALQGAVAAGLDYRISRRVTWRIVQVEQLRRFGDHSRNMTSTSTGLVFGLGGR